MTENDSHLRVERQLDAVAEESAIFLVKAFRGAVRMDEPENRILASAASSGIGAWTRYEATKSQRQQTDIIRSAIFARDLGGRQIDYLPDAPKQIEGGQS